MSSSKHRNPDNRAMATGRNKVGGDSSNSKNAISSTNNKQKPKQHHQGDDKNQHDILPGGTIHISRGLSSKQSIEKRTALKRERVSQMSNHDKQRLQSYLFGPYDYQNKKRREALRHDDKNMNTSTTLTMTPIQQRALMKRKRRGADKVLKAKLTAMETKRLEAAVAAVDAEDILHTEQAGFVQVETDMERTTGLRQLELKRKYLDEQTSKHIYDLKLHHHGPYGLKYDRSGRCSVLYGTTGGHVAIMDNFNRTLLTEFHVRETVRDAAFLHNTTMFALAQRNHVFVYDNAGVEIHRLDEHNDPFCLEFLPYHWLLVSIGRSGWLKYHDTSTGTLVSQHRTKLGACSVMRQNPTNAIIHCGHTNGTVTLWSPASSEYLVKMQCHRGSPVRSLALDHTGRYMVTGGGGGADPQVKIWDLRMYRETHAYYTRGGRPPSAMDISQRGVLGIGHGIQTTFWSGDALKTKARDPYMRHDIPGGCGPARTLRFRPHEDVVGIGHGGGVSSIVIPGCGEPNLDSMEYNTDPYQDLKQRREAEVRSLLDKLSPEMIALDPDVVGTVEESDPTGRLDRVRSMAAVANAAKEKKRGGGDDHDDEVEEKDEDGGDGGGDESEKKLTKRSKEKNKMRGRSKIQKKLARKHKNIIDERTVKLREAREREKEERKKELASIKGNAVENPRDKAPPALKRFF